MQGFVSSPAWEEDVYKRQVFLPEPALIDFPSKDAPGWWDTPRRAQVMDAFNQARTCLLYTSRCV